MERIAKETYEGKLKPKDFDREHVLKTYQEINKAAGTGYGKGWLTVNKETGFPGPEVLKMRQNIYKFAHAKDYAMLVEINNLLTKDGKLANWNDFKAGVLKLNKKYNLNHLQAEWQTAKHSGYMANLWDEYQSNKKLFPNLKYKIQGDDRVRKEHEKLKDIIKPIDDAFWKSYYPPNGWRCRCYVVQSAEQPTADSKMPNITPDDVKEEFRNNPTVTGQIFKDQGASKDHPYFVFLREQAGLQKKVDRSIFGALQTTAKEVLVKKVANHPLAGKIGFNKPGIKEAFNQPHKYYTDKNWLIQNMDTIIPKAEYLGKVKSVKPNPMIKWIHVFKIIINKEPSYILVRERTTGEKIFYTISDNPKVAEGAKK